MTRLTFGILYSQICQTHANCRWKWLKQQNIFYVKLFLIKNSALIEFDVLRLDSAKNSRKIRWKIAFVRQRQVYMSLVKILVAENSMYILQILFENLVSSAVGRTTVCLSKFSFVFSQWALHLIELLAILFKMYSF